MVDCERKVLRTVQHSTRKKEVGMGKRMKGVTGSRQGAATEKRPRSNSDLTSPGKCDRVGKGQKKKSDHGCHGMMGHTAAGNAQNAPVDHPLH